MTADALTFGPKYLGAQAIRRMRRVLANVVDAAGLGICAAAVESSKSDLRQAVDGEPGRYVRIDWLPELLRFASVEDRKAFINEFLALFDMEAVPKSRRSIERRLIDLETRLKEELGPVGSRIVDDERSRP